MYRGWHEQIYDMTGKKHNCISFGFFTFKSVFRDIYICTSTSLNLYLTTNYKDFRGVYIPHYSRWTCFVPNTVWFNNWAGPQFKPDSNFEPCHNSSVKGWVTNIFSSDIDNRLFPRMREPGHLIGEQFFKNVILFVFTALCKHSRSDYTLKHLNTLPLSFKIASSIVFDLQTIERRIRFDISNNKCFK